MQCAIVCVVMDSIHGVIKLGFDTAATVGSARPILVFEDRLTLVTRTFSQAITDFLYSPYHRYVKKYTFGYNCVIVKGDSITYFF